MTPPDLLKISLLSTCLSLTACTETIIREVPTDTDQGSTNTLTDDEQESSGSSSLGDNANMVPISPGQETGETQEPVIGTAGEPVDCNKVVPCRWVSEDDQFSLTITNADNIASMSRLGVYYTISTAHDTTLTTSSAGEITTTTGRKLKPIGQVLGGGSGGVPQALAAGSFIEGFINYDAANTSDSLSDWSVSVLDGGIVRTANFSNIPVGTASKSQADCNNTLPCIWTNPQSNIAITLQSVGGFQATGRLTVNFSIESPANIPVALDKGAMAVGITGTPFEGRTHNFIGKPEDYRKVTSQAISGIPLFGQISFFRTDKQPTSLHALAFVLYEDNPVPRWNPQFINVPVQ